MPVLVWIIIAVVGLGAGTAVVVPAVVGNSKDEVKQTAPVDPKPPAKTIEVESTPIEVETDTTSVDEPLVEKLPYAEEPLIPLGKNDVRSDDDADNAGGMANKLPF